MSAHEETTPPKAARPRRLSAAPIGLDPSTTTPDLPVYNRAFAPLRTTTAAPEKDTHHQPGSPWATARPDSATTSVGGGRLVVSPRADGGVRAAPAVDADPGGPADAGAAPAGGTPRFGRRSQPPAAARHDAAGWEAGGGRGPLFEGIAEEEEGEGEGEEDGGGGGGDRGGPPARPGLGDTVEAAGPPPPPPAGASPPPGAPLDDGYDDMCGE